MTKQKPNTYFAIKYSFTAIAVLVLIACGNQYVDKNELLSAAVIMKNTDKKLPYFNANSDTLIIDQTCAVFVSADSLQIEKKKKEFGDDFYVVADDYMYYLYETRIFLDSMKLKIVNCDSKKFLKFVYASQKPELIDLRNSDRLWEVYLFDPKRKSKAIDIIMIKEAYTDFFK